MPVCRDCAGAPYGWYESEFYAVSEVTLAIEPGETGTPTLKIYRDSSTEAVPVAFVEGCDDGEAREVDLVERILRSSNDVDFDDFIDGFPFWPRRAHNHECDEALKKLGVANAKLGYKNGLWDILGDNWSADDIPLWAETVAGPLVGEQDSARDGLLFAGGSKYRFYPNFFFDEENTDGAPAGSLAAAIIANFHAGSPEARIADQLLEQANKIAKVGLAYANEVRERHLNAIRQI